MGRRMGLRACPFPFGLQFRVDFQQPLFHNFPVILCFIGLSAIFAKALAQGRIIFERQDCVLDSINVPIWHDMTAVFLLHNFGGSVTKVL
jgi:hypothetical protein